MQFDLAGSGILAIVRDTLLQYNDSTSVLEARLDKINVYGEGPLVRLSLTECLD